MVIILTNMRCEDFFSTKPLKALEEAIHKGLKNITGEPVNWVRICWRRFIKRETYKIFYKESMEVQNTWFISLSGKTKELQQNKIDTMIQEFTSYFNKIHIF